MMHSSMSTASDETPIMSNSINSTMATSAENGDTATTQRTGSMRRAAAMAAAASALSSSAMGTGSGHNNSSRPSSPRSSPKDKNGLLTQQEQSQQQRNTTGPQRRRHRSTPADNFHPRLITAQILSLQCFHYTIQGFLFQVNFLLYNTSITIDRIFTDEHVQIWHSAGWPDVAAIFFSALIGAVLLAVIVEKSKKCLDFCVTYFLLHLILCSWYAGHMPRTTDWWIVHLAATLLMVLVGEYACSRKELLDIPLLEI